MLVCQSVRKQENFERDEAVEGSYGKICTDEMKLSAKRRQWQYSCSTTVCCFVKELFQLFEKRHNFDL